MENLNNINNKKEDEFKAKEILVRRFPKRYKGLISNESPDFVGKNVGLEITNAVDENEREIKSFCIKNAYKTIEKSRNGYINKNNKQIQAGQTNYKPILRDVDDKSILYGFTTINMQNSLAFLENIKVAVHAKLNKLNKNYIVFDQNDICIIIGEEYGFIEVGECELKEEIECLCNHIIETIKVIYAEESFKVYFDLVHVMFDNLVVSVDTKIWTPITNNL